MDHCLRIPPNQLRIYCEKYDYGYDPKLSHLKATVEQHGFLTCLQLNELALWKSPRRAGLVFENEEIFVQEVTRFAFSAEHEHSRIGALALLKGVRYPIASVVLHFCVDTSYPILDFRAIWSLGMDQPSAYSPEYWCDYISLCRSLAAKHGLTVRELDMALWQFSREHQREA
jgi:hypothetical protein